MFHGLLQYRALLHSCDLVNGFMWIDGSFIEDCEIVHNRPPADIDIVTFVRRPAALKDDEQWDRFMQQHTHILFDRAVLKGQYGCDGYYVDLDLSSETIVEQTHYWFGLFSHHRSTRLWKGLLELPLVADDSHMLELIGRRDD